MRFIRDGGASRVGFTALWGKQIYSGRTEHSLTMPQTTYPVVVVEHEWQVRISWSQIALWRRRGDGYQQFFNLKNPLTNRWAGR